MRKTGEYETPEIEVTRFELTRGIMDVIGGGGNDDGDEVFDENVGSNPDDGGDLPFPTD